MDALRDINPDTKLAVWQEAAEVVSRGKKYGFIVNGSRFRVVIVPGDHGIGLDGKCEVCDV
jgi:hypothetical protein